ncbi:hypothetical protein OAC34_01965 [Schleiferiaceae bacterium]|nr:hypothetical protein [Schleiferiaceae bacterium]MDB9837599.1 hypothetical protein [Schleiferiaceae bacterium]
MKGTYQIYLFAATLLVAIGFFIQRSFGGPSSLYATETDLGFDWEVRHFDEALFGGDSLDMKELATYFNPFFESNPIPNFWKQELANPTLRDHYSNVQNLMDKSAIANDLQAISARANALLGLPLPDQLFFYISGIDLETPCLYFPGAAQGDLKYAFVGLDNFLGAGYPGYEGIPAYQRDLLRQSQLPVAYAHALLATLSLENFNDPTLVAQMVYQGKIALATEALTGYSIETSEVLGYRPEEWSFLETSESNIWEVMVREKMLFSTDMMVRQRLAEPAPFSKLGTAMDGDIPGRVARYIGYKLVKSYAENHRELSLKEIIKIRDAQKFLRDAQYKP